MDIFDVTPDPVPEKTVQVRPKQVEETLPVPLERPGGVLAQLAAEAGVVVPEDAFEALDGFMDSAKYGHQSCLPMKCKGGRCPILDLCPIAKLGLDLPVGKRCPVESALIKQWVETYLGALDIDPNSPEYAIDMHMVYELAGLELMRTRAAQHLSTEPELVKNEIVGYSPQGEPIYDDKPSMALLIMEKQGKSVNKLREGLLATRKTQAQAGQMVGDVSVRTANIQEKARKILEARQAGGKIGDVKTVDADFEVKDDPSE
jgi:hypothetical protein